MSTSEHDGNCGLGGEALGVEALAVTALTGTAAEAGALGVEALAVAALTGTGAEAGTQGVGEATEAAVTGAEGGALGVGETSEATVEATSVVFWRFAAGIPGIAESEREQRACRGFGELENGVGERRERERGTATTRNF